MAGERRAEDAVTILGFRRGGPLRAGGGMPSWIGCLLLWLITGVNEAQLKIKCPPEFCPVSIPS